MYRTVAEVLRDYVPSDLNLRGSSSTNQTTHAANPRTEFAVKRTWDTFDADLRPYLAELEAHGATELLLADCERIRVSNEADIRHSFRYAIGIPVTKLLRVLNCDGEFTGATGVHLDPDLIWCDGDAAKFLVEIKTPWSFPRPGRDGDLIAAWARRDPDRKIYRAVTQLYGYMSMNHMKFGVLSTYDHTWFFRRIPHHAGGAAIEISRAVGKAEIVSVMTAFALMTRESPFYSLPEASPIVKRRSPISIRFRYNLKLIKSDDFKFEKRVAGPTDFGAIRGHLAGHDDRLVFKTVDISSTHGLAARMDHEVNIYRTLQSIQGDIIPMFIGYVDFNGLFRAIVLQDGGRCLTRVDLLRRDIRNQLKDRVRRIHALGVLHGDLALRNVVMDAAGAIRVIDFSHSRLLSSIAKRDRRRRCQAELDAIDDLY